MNLHILIQIIFSFLFIVSASAADAQSIAKPGCTRKCGDVNIFYPFGIGDGCYHNEWYEITCNTTTNIPFLTKFNMEVLNVSSYDYYGDRSITVMNPVASNCVRQKGNTNFSGSPYSFSPSYNQFTVVGCGNAQLLDSNSTIAGCSSSCKTNTTNKRGCYGINCCQTSVPSYYDFSSYTISFEVNATINCTYAFLLEINSDEEYYSALSFINNTKQVPVQLYWKIYNLSSYNYCSAYRRYSSEDYKDYTCRCPWAHKGNPYIPDGCKIDKACANCEKDCRYAGGGFYCRHTYKTEKILGGSFGGALSFLVLFAFSFWLYKFIKKRRSMNRKKKFFKRNGGLLLEQQISFNKATVEKTIIFTSNELKKATDNYNVDRILGQGGQGTVYKGMLTDGKITAVKKSKVIDEGQLEQFINEVVILSQINHRNIVNLLGCCLETEVPLLVYEFVLNGNLFDLIHNKNEEFPLSWKMRMQIATEVAGALAYLHFSSSIPIYHRDVKSTNILLDEKFRAKVSDFGTSRSITIEQTHLTTLVYGTFGYLDPEYFQSSQFTDKSDVYSFGVVLVELLTGQKPISSDQSEEEKSLATRFILYMEKMRVFDIVDDRVLEEAPKEEIIAVSKIARQCLNLNGKKRPTMKEVVRDLEVISRAPSTHSLITLNQDTFNIKKKRNCLDDGYSTSTMIMSDYRAFSSSDVEPLVFYTQ